MAATQRRTIRSFAVLLLGMVTVTISAPAQDGPTWLRYPALSPDGATIVFTYRGDLYRMASTGGTAVPLTTNAADDFMPVWSPDGSQLAFASDRTGNLDVWIMPSSGGVASRLTHHSTDDRPWSFSPDGSNVLFGSTRIDAANSQVFPDLSELYAVPNGGGRVRQLLTTPVRHASMSPDGGHMLYQDYKGGEDPFRKYHVSSVTGDIWQYDGSTGSHRQLTNTPGDDLEPVYSPDGQHVFFLSAAGAGTINVYRMRIDGQGEPEALTNFDRHAVRSLSTSDDGLLAFSWNGDLYTLRPGQQPVRVVPQIAIDRQHRSASPVSVTSGASGLAVSPNGREVAFVFRGEIFVTSVESSVTKQITQTPEQERSVSFSPDGRSLLYAGERRGSWNLYRTDLKSGESHFFNATILSESVILETAAETFQPAFSPDGLEVAFLEDREALKVLNLASGAVRTILPDSLTYSYADGDQYYEWSPDGKWFLVEYLMPGYWPSEIGLARADGSGSILNLTESGFPDYRPKWSANGSMMLWFSSRDGLRSVAGTGSTQADAYGLFFNRKAEDRFKLSEEDFELLTAAEKKDSTDVSKKEKTAKPDTTVIIEEDGLRDRRTRLTIHSSALSDAIVTPDASKLLYLTRFEKDYAVWQTDLRTKETKQLVSLGSSGGSLHLEKAGKFVFILSGGSISKLEISTGKRTPVPFSGSMMLDEDAERAYLFDHAWRQVREKFLVPDLHGARWDSLKVEYQRFLPHIGSNRAFAELLSELLGELNASHTGGRYRSSTEASDQTASVGIIADPQWDGPGLRVAEVLEDGPLDRSDVRALVGSVLTAINGEEIGANSNVARMLRGIAGANTRLQFSGGGDVWDVVIKPISRAAESSLLYTRWVRHREHLADSLSGGRVGYVHIRGMNDGSYRTVVEYVQGRHVTKEAIIIDTRFNGGGDLVDDIVTYFSGRHYADFVAPDGQLVGAESQRKWTKPSVMLTAEDNYSDAHCTPWAYQYLEVGKVIGAPVPGTCSFVWWERMQNGVVFGIPNMAMTDGPGGPPLENRQLEPDILVLNRSEDAANGRDAQLEAAVRELLDQLDR